MFFTKCACRCHFGDKSYGETGVGVSAAERINNKQTLAGKLMGDKSFQMLPGFRGERFVIVLTFALISPPQRIAGGVISDDILIFRRTTGKNTRIDGDSTRGSSTHHARILPVPD